MTQDQQAPAGWYLDPQRPETQRYWDGTHWTDHIAPRASATPSGGPSDNLILAGWLTAFFVPIVGFVIGCVVVSRRPDHGVLMMLAAVASTIFWLSAYY
jgi:hypothetical protein